MNTADLINIKAIVYLVEYADTFTFTFVIVRHILI